MPSFTRGIRIRLTINPGASSTLTGTFPISCDKANTWSCTSAEVSRPLITSTSFIAGTGLKKCIPITFSGRLVTAATSVIESEEVLVANIASGLQIPSNNLNISCLVAISSAIASITKSASAQSSYFIVSLILANTWSLTPASNLPFSTILERFLSIALWAFAKEASERPFNNTSCPAWANTWAIPCPIVPVPTMHIFIIDKFKLQRF